MTWSDDAWQSVKPTYEQILEHPFVHPRRPGVRLRHRRGRGARRPAGQAGRSGRYRADGRGLHPVRHTGADVLGRSINWMAGFTLLPGLIEEYVETAGAILAGRAGFDAGLMAGHRPYGGSWDGPIFVLAHHVDDVDAPRVARFSTVMSLRPSRSAWRPRRARISRSSYRPSAHSCSSTDSSTRSTSTWRRSYSATASDCSVALAASQCIYGGPKLTIRPGPSTSVITHMCDSPPRYPRSDGENGEGPPHKARPVGTANGRRRPSDGPLAALRVGCIGRWTAAAATGVRLAV